jgi:phosphotriesterase-related protein
MSIETVLGPIDASQLGKTAMHEHVLVDVTSRRREQASRCSAWELPVSLQTHAAVRSNPSLHRDNLLLEYDLMVEELQLLADSGTRSLLDVTAVGLRGDIARLPELSRRTQVHIVASTGFYKEASWPAEIRGWKGPQFEHHMVTELRDAVRGAEFRAGHVKCGLSTMSEPELDCLRVSAAVAAEHGLSMTIHPSFGDPDGPVRAAKIAIETGLAPERVVMAHCDAFLCELSLDRLIVDPASWGLRLDKVKAVLDTGATASIDCFGQAWTDELYGWITEADWQRLAGLFQLLGQGYSAQLVVSCDIAKKMLTRRFGGHGYTRVNDWVIPKLLELGVPPSDIDQMLVHNPARILERRRP